MQVGKEVPALRTAAEQLASSAEATTRTLGASVER